MGRRVLRPGPIPEVELKRYFPVQDQGSPTNRSDAGPRPSPGKGVVSPGQLPSHYAPSKPLRLHATSAATDEWLIGLGAVAGDDTLSATGDPVEAAARLFDARYRSDASSQSRHAVDPVPAGGVRGATDERLGGGPERQGVV